MNDDWTHTVQKYPQITQRICWRLDECDVTVFLIQRPGGATDRGRTKHFLTAGEKTKPKTQHWTGSSILSHVTLPLIKKAPDSSPRGHVWQTAGGPPQAGHGRVDLITRPLHLFGSTSL